MHDTDRLLQQLIDHPPHDPPSASDPAFTAAVFGRIRASPAPRTQPSIACGPPMAATISGSVMNGPPPIMSSMFSATAPGRFRLRESCASLGLVSMGRVYPALREFRSA